MHTDVYTTQLNITAEHQHWNVRISNAGHEGHI